MDKQFDELIEELMEDETWEVPKEQREMLLWGIEWTLNEL